MDPSKKFNDPQERYNPHFFFLTGEINFSAHKKGQTNFYQDYYRIVSNTQNVCYYMGAISFMSNENRA